MRLLSGQGVGWARGVAASKPPGLKYLQPQTQGHGLVCTFFFWGNDSGFRTMSLPICVRAQALQKEPQRGVLGASLPIWVLTRDSSRFGIKVKFFLE